jgi:ABC-type multidrug transport system fused ATPase/permease subunit
MDLSIGSFSKSSRTCNTNSLGSFIQTQSLSRSHGEEFYELSRVEKVGNEELIKIKHLRTAEALFASLNSVISEMALLCVVAAGAYGVMKGTLSLGQLILFLQFINLIIDLIRNILNFFPEFTAFSEAVVSIREITDSPDQEYNEGKVKLNPIRGGIVFQNVSFGHTPEAPLFRDLSVRIAPGTTVALVGGSGSGKTTFVNLILGLYRTQSGVIKIDDHPISSLDMRAVRRQMAVVTQDAIIFTGSVKDNIIYAMRVHNQKEIEEAAKDAHAFDFINQLDKKFDTLIGEGGQPLSGGQKQRISIARALLRHPKILILDEATSALDSESEEEVQKALEEIQGKQTTLIIAHRLSTIAGADRILVFKNGKIIEDGKHQELVAKGGEYAKLVSLQTSGLELNA